MVALRASGNRVEYLRGPLTEWYVNGPLGLEQGFTLTEPPPRSKGRVTTGQRDPLTIALTRPADVTAVVDASRTNLSLTRRDGQAALRYTGLTARDAAGKSLRAWLDLQPDRLLLGIQDAAARYPVTVDPWVQSAKLTPSGEMLMGTLGGPLGWLAFDGGNVVDICNLDTAAWAGACVFAEPPGGWTNMTQTAELSFASSTTGYDYGFSDAVAASGNTVVVGEEGVPSGGGATGFPGAAYVFVQPSGG
jgi:hypothetical protein